jgi:hypothetical protein
MLTEQVTPSDWEGGNNEARTVPSQSKNNREYERQAGRDPETDPPTQPMAVTRQLPRKEDGAGVGGETHSFGL